MANNEFLVKRTAHGIFSMPTNNATVNTAGKVEAEVKGCYIPSGAIITGIRYFVLDAISGSASLSAAQISPVIGALAVANSATASRAANSLLVQTVPTVQALTAANGVYVAAGDQLKIDIGITNNITGIKFDANVYVDYIVVK